MMQNSHVTQLIPDYALDLLSDKDSRIVTYHLASCAECRQQLRLERRVARTVRDTLSIATRYDQNKIQTLKPKTVFEGKPLLPIQWQPRLALVGLLLIFAFAAFIGQTRLRQELRSVTSPAIFSTVAVATDTPTLTLSATKERAKPNNTAVPTPIASDMFVLPRPAVIPVPAAPIFR